jgi:hypothetical protein
MPGAKSANAITQTYPNPPALLTKIYASEEENSQNNLPSVTVGEGVSNGLGYEPFPNLSDRIAS